MKRVGSAIANIMQTFSTGSISQSLAQLFSCLRLCEFHPCAVGALDRKNIDGLKYYSLKILFGPIGIKQRED